MFLDDRKHDFFVGVISLDNIRRLDITARFLLLITFPSKGSQNHPSESPIPLTSLLRGPKREEDAQRTENGNPPPILNPESRILSSGGPNRSGVLIDPREICVDDVPPWPDNRPSGGLRKQIADGQSNRQHECDEAQDDEADVEG